jgi:hypothetical protein
MAKALYYFKFVGLTLIALGIPVLLLDRSSGSDIPLLVGLFMVLTVTEKMEDERSLQIKTTSLYIAFIISYGVKLITSNLYDHQLIPFELVEINHFLILILSLANIIFYSRMFILRS